MKNFIKDEEVEELIEDALEETEDYTRAVDAYRNKKPINVEDAIPQIMNLVGSLVDSQMMLDAPLRVISDRLTEIFSTENELKLMSQKDLLKLWEFTQKQRLQPVESLTKLIQAVTALKQANELGSKLGKLDTIINSFDQQKASANVPEAVVVVEPQVTGHKI